VEAVFHIKPFADESESMSQPSGLYSYWRKQKMSYRFQFEVEREANGRGIEEIPKLPGVMVCGKTKHNAVHSARALALRVLADRRDEAPC
jgi:hypothetical protein